MLYLGNVVLPSNIGECVADVMAKSGGLGMLRKDREYDGATLVGLEGHDDTGLCRSLLGFWGRDEHIGAGTDPAAHAACGAAGHQRRAAAGGRGGVGVLMQRRHEMRILSGEGDLRPVWEGGVFD